MDNSREPELAEVLRDASENGLLETHTSMPCKVVKCYPETQTVDVKPLVKRAWYDETDTRQTESVPVIPNVPVGFMGGGGFRVTFPVAVGDIGAVIFFECSVDRWQAGDGKEVDPVIDHHHALMDAWFFPGACRPQQRALASAPTDEATLGHDTGVQIHMTKGLIAMGNKSATDSSYDFVAMSKKVHDTLARLQTILDAILDVSIPTKIINEPGNGSPSALQAALGAALKAAKLIGTGSTWPDSVASTTLKAK